MKSDESKRAARLSTWSRERGPKPSCENRAHKSFHRNGIRTPDCKLRNEPEKSGAASEPGRSLTIEHEGPESGFQAAGPFNTLRTLAQTVRVSKITCKYAAPHPLRGSKSVIAEQTQTEHKAKTETRSLPAGSRSGWQQAANRFTGPNASSTFPGCPPNCRIHWGRTTFHSPPRVWDHPWSPPRLHVVDGIELPHGIGHRTLPSAVE